MNEALTSLAYLLVIGGFAGYLIGILAKKVIRIAIIVGVFAFSLMYLAYTKAISLNFEEVGSKVSQFAEIISPLGFTALASSTPFVGSFIVGFFIGLRRS